MTITEVIEELRSEIDASFKSYVNNTIEFIKWTTTFLLAALLWIGNSSKGISELSRPLVLDSVILLGISFFAAIMVFFLLLFVQASKIADDKKDPITHIFLFSHYKMKCFS